MQPRRMKYEAHAPGLLKQPQCPKGPGNKSSVGVLPKLDAYFSIPLILNCTLPRC